MVFETASLYQDLVANGQKNCLDLHSYMHQHMAMKSYAQGRYSSQLCVYHSAVIRNAWPILIVDYQIRHNYIAKTLADYFKN